MDTENNSLKISNSENISSTKYFVKTSNNKNPFILYIIILTLIIINILFYILFFNKNNDNISNYQNKLNKIIQISNENKQEILNIGNKFEKKNLEEKIKLLKMFTNNNDVINKGMENCLVNDPDSQLCIYHLIAPKKVVGKKRILIGKKDNGCYVLLDDFKNIRYAYSFGISFMIQFDDELANRGIDIYMYDHTINSLPYNKTKFHWQKKGLAGKDEITENLNTIENYLIENGHKDEKDMILKIDTEGAEWSALIDISEDVLNQFKYILMELHFTNTKNGEIYYKVLKKLHKTHQVFYHRCAMRNVMIQFGNNNICSAIELSYVIRKDNTFEKDDSIYPNYDFDWHGPNFYDKSFEVNLNILKLFDS